MKTFTMKYCGCEYTWDVEVIWEATSTFEGEALPLTELEHTLDWDCWSGEMYPSNLLYHYQRVIDADLHFPIIVTRNQWGNIDHVVDGMHRIVKAFAHSHEKIMAKEIGVDWLTGLPTISKNCYCGVCGCDPCDCNWGNE